jgi:hypothetical protein
VLIKTAQEANTQHHHPPVIFQLKVTNKESKEKSMDKRRESHIKFRQAPGNQSHGEHKHFLPGIGHPRLIAPVPALIL